MKRTAMSRRQFLGWMGATAGATVLAACAAPVAPETGGVAQAPGAAEKPTLRYRTWHSRGQSEGDSAWYDWLSENYTDASLEYEFVPFGSEYIQKVLADSAAGTPPDLLHSSIIWAREFYDRGVLLELDDFIADVPELAPDQFYGDATNRYRSKDGKYYGVPWEGPDSAIIAVNSTMLAEAGYDPQGADIQTWDDFTEAAIAMTKMDGNLGNHEGAMSAPNKVAVLLLREIRDALKGMDARLSRIEGQMKPAEPPAEAEAAGASNAGEDAPEDKPKTAAKKQRKTRAKATGKAKGA